MSEYPKLMFGTMGDEITVCSPTEEEARASDGYVLTQPGSNPPAELEADDVDEREKKSAKQPAKKGR
jgi:hypothetical protein